VSGRAFRIFENNYTDIRLFAVGCSKGCNTSGVDDTRHRAVSLRQHGFLVSRAIVQQDRILRLKVYTYRFADMCDHNHGITIARGGHAVLFIP